MRFEKPWSIGARKLCTLVDVKDGRRARAFKYLGQGRPCLSTSNTPQRKVELATSPQAIVSLEDPKTIMLLASQILEDDFSGNSEGLPPLAESLVKRMTDLSKVLGRDVV